MDETEINDVLAEIGQPNDAGGAGAGGTPPEQAAPPAQQTPADWRQGFDWQFDHNGQKVSPDSADKARTWLSLGHNYSQRAAELNKSQAQLAREREELQGKYRGFDRYQEIDQFAKTNPDWWKHVEQSWQQRSTFGQDPNLQPLLQRLEATEGLLQTFKQEREQQQLSQQDQALEAEIGEIRKSYPNIDLGSVDDSGRSLEFRVLQHANEHGINSFRAAFRDYLHDRLVEEAKTQGREAIAKDTQAKTRAGVLGTTPAPTKGLKPANDVRGRSYDQLAQEALAELGI